MSGLRTFAACSSVLLGLALPACGSSSSGSAAPTAGAADNGGAPGSSSNEAGGGTGAPGANADPGFTYVNVANASAAAPAVDLCLSVRGSGAWDGPILARGTADAPGAVKADGVTLGTDAASMFVKTKPGTYDFRVVAAGGDCTVSLADVSNAASLNGGGGATILVTGKSGAIEAHAYPSEFHARTAVRFIHAASGIDHVDFKIGSGLIAQNLHSDVGPHEAGRALGSPGGYVGVSAAHGPPFSVGAAGTTDVALAFDTNLADVSSDVILIGQAGSSTDPLRTVICTSDLVQRNSGAQDCSIHGLDLSAGPTAHIRYGNFMNVGADTTLCIKSPGASAFRNLVDGVLGPNLTRYYPVPAGTTDVGIVAPGGDCTTALLATASVNLASNSYTTQLVFGPNATPTPRSLVDTIDLGPDKAKLRLVHAAQATGALIGGTGNAGTFTKMFDALNYGDASPIVPFDGLVNGLVTVRLATTPAVDASMRDTMFIDKGQTWTAFAVIGTKFNSSETEIQVMVCNDTGIPISSRTGCRDPRSGM